MAETAREEIPSLFIDPEMIRRLRRHNDGRFDRYAFTVAVTTLEAEVVNSRRWFRCLPLDDATIFATPS